jgi:phosphoesterase RecJ-like protein
MALQIEKQILEAVGKGDHILVIFRKEWTPDAVASALALARLIEARGKKADVVCDGFAPAKQVSFLPDIDRIAPELGKLRKFVISLDVTRNEVDEMTYVMNGDRLDIMITPKSGLYKAADVSTRSSAFKYDLIVTVDTPDLGALCRPFAEHPELFYDTPIINVDHGPHNENFGNINAVDITATSAAELVHRLLREANGGLLSEETATLLLTGIISKTKSFKSANVTPKTLDVAAELVAAGAKRDEIVQNLYKTRSIATLKLWGQALARIKHDPATGMAWAILTRDDFVHSGSDEQCLPDVIDELMVTAPEAEIVGLIYEQDGAGICALVSSERHADSLGLVPDLRPEGSRSMARICFPDHRIHEAEQAVLQSIRKSLGKTAGGPRLEKNIPIPAASSQAKAPEHSITGMVGGRQDKAAPLAKLIKNK